MTVPARPRRCTCRHADVSRRLAETGYLLRHCQCGFAADRLGKPAAGGRPRRARHRAGARRGAGRH